MQADSSLAPHERLPEILVVPREKPTRAPQLEETPEMSWGHLWQPQHHGREGWDRLSLALAVEVE